MNLLDTSIKQLRLSPRVKNGRKLLTVQAKFDQLNFKTCFLMKSKDRRKSISLIKARSIRLSRVVIFLGLICLRREDNGKTVLILQKNKGLKYLMNI